MYEQETTKYRIHLTVQAEGVVDRSDVVGAIFGQVEGLLGSELELRELQRQGRLGRIDVRVVSKQGRSSGEILVSTSLDRAETAILAASMETISRVGPCAAQVQVQNIEDIRVTKRNQIIERAKSLLLEFEEPGIDPESLIDAVRESQRIEKIETIGPDNVPAGPNVLQSDAIIVVEGRADVINLLRAGIKNAIAVEGTSVPGTIISMCHKKTATAFLDGDRGGDLILRELLEVTDIDFVAFPPRGESVEDLSRKEIIKSLRNKVPIEYVLEDRVAEYLANRDKEGKAAQKNEEPEEEVPSPQESEEVPESPEPEEPAQAAHEPPVTEEVSDPPYKPRSVFTHISEVRERGVIRMLSGEGDVVLEMPVAQIEDSPIPDDQTFQGVVIDQDVNQQLLDQLSLLGIKFLAAPSFTGIVRRPASVRLIPFR
ncbi:MAG TPA: DNA primase DnaG [Methanospirillum sp.]|uniref:DNA primase DnaG n=1 Tax=Methanospirillum sp. TaxID=45200 RepID=UPI002C084AAD|nr:DNA primase DnaG [Methanospirillum sp.]HWQ64990.1 DNA primase DnaG [Methanospirillum sp.]